MEALDGNAAAGHLYDAFGEEMTSATCTCARCGLSAFVAELRVYMQAPGTVIRCRGCESVLIVLTDVRSITCVDLGGLAALEPAAGRLWARQR
jgi:uncharacterized protein DUF6510